MVGVLSKPPFCTNPNINPSEKATLAQDPCIILHFLTGSHVFSIVTAVISSYLLFFARSHLSPNPNPNLHPGEKATLAQNPCMIWHFLTGSHVFSTKSVTPETVWSRGTLISRPGSPTSSKMAKNEKNVEKWTNPAKSDP